jgi:hypothetical protein
MSIEYASVQSERNREDLVCALYDGNVLYYQSLMLGLVVISGRSGVSCAASQAFLRLDWLE